MPYLPNLRVLLAIVLALVLGVAVLAASHRSSEPADDPRPNVIVITTDDQSLSTVSPKTMPRTADLFGRKGTRFSNYVATTPSCCPSRASFLTGQFAHNHGVLSNQAGYPALEQKGSTLPAWLQAAGYRTAQVGKFLNKYGNVARPHTRPAPGYDEWYALLAPYRYYGPEMSVNGRRVKLGRAERNYVTRVLARKAARFVKRSAQAGEPFYLQLDHLAPHVGNVRSGDRLCATTAVPERRDRAQARGDVRLHGPAIDEDRISDKPAFIRELPTLGPLQREKLSLQERCRVASLRAVDRSIDRLRGALRRADELANTMFVYTSDNGRFNGEHRIVQGKSLPYEEAVRLPLMIRFPNQVRRSLQRRGAWDRQVVGDPVANIDLAPTILDVTGVEPCLPSGECRTMDGRSLLALMSAEDDRWARRAILLEYGDREGRHGRLLACNWRAVRTARFVYALYTSVTENGGGRCNPTLSTELYDLAADPYQLRNLSGEPGSRSLEASLTRRLAELRDCAGIAGRDPLPPSRQYCE